MTKNNYLLENSKKKNNNILAVKIPACALRDKKIILERKGLKNKPHEATGLTNTRLLAHIEPLTTPPESIEDTLKHLKASEHTNSVLKVYNLLLHYGYMHQRSGKLVYILMNTIANTLKVSPKTVQRATNRLVELGLLKKTKRYERSNLFLFPDALMNDSFATRVSFFLPSLRTISLVIALGLSVFQSSVLGGVQLRKRFSFNDSFTMRYSSVEVSLRACVRARKIFKQQTRKHEKMFMNESYNPLTPVAYKAALILGLNKFDSVSLLAFPDHIIERATQELIKRLLGTDVIERAFTYWIGIARNLAAVEDIQLDHSIPATIRYNLDLSPDEEIYEYTYGTLVNYAQNVTAQREVDDVVEEEISKREERDLCEAEAVYNYRNNRKQLPKHSSYRSIFDDTTPDMTEDPIEAFLKIEAHYRSNPFTACLPPEANPWYAKAKEAGFDVDSEASRRSEHRYAEPEILPDSLPASLQNEKKPPEEPLIAEFEEIFYPSADEPFFDDEIYYEEDGFPEGVRFEDLV